MANELLEQIENLNSRMFSPRESELAQINVIKSKIIFNPENFDYLVEILITFNCTDRINLFLIDAIHNHVKLYYSNIDLRNLLQRMLQNPKSSLYQGSCASYFANLIAFLILVDYNLNTEINMPPIPDVQFESLVIRYIIDYLLSETFSFCPEKYITDENLKKQPKSLRNPIASTYKFEMKSHFLSFYIGDFFRESLNILDKSPELGVPCLNKVILFHNKQDESSSFMIPSEYCNILRERHIFNELYGYFKFAPKEFSCEILNLCCTISRILYNSEDIDFVNEMFSVLLTFLQSENLFSSHLNIPPLSYWIDSIQSLIPVIDTKDIIIEIMKHDFISIHPIHFLEPFKAVLNLSIIYFNNSNDESMNNLIHTSFYTFINTLIDSIPNFHRDIYSELNANDSMLNEILTMLWKFGNDNICNNLAEKLTNIQEEEFSDPNVVKFSLIMEILMIFFEQKIYINSYNYFSAFLLGIMNYTSKITPLLPKIDQNKVLTINVEYILDFLLLFFKTYPKQEDFAVVAKITSHKYELISLTSFNLAMICINHSLFQEKALLLLNSLFNSNVEENRSIYLDKLTKYVSVVNLNTEDTSLLRILVEIYHLYSNLQENVLSLIPAIRNLDNHSFLLFFGFYGELLASFSKPKDWIERCKTVLVQLKATLDLLNKIEEVPKEIFQILFKFVIKISKTFPESNDWPSKNTVRFKLFYYINHILFCFSKKISNQISDSKHNLVKENFDLFTKCIKSMNCLLDSPIGNIGSMIALNDGVFVDFVIQTCTIISNINQRLLLPFPKFHFNFLAFIRNVVQYLPNIMKMSNVVLTVFISYLKIPFFIPSQNMLDKTAPCLIMMLQVVDQKLLEPHFVMSLNSICFDKSDITSLGAFICMFNNMDSSCCIQVSAKYSSFFTDMKIRRKVRTVFNKLFEGEEDELDEEGNLVQMVALQQFVDGIKKIGVRIDSIEELLPFFH